MSSGKLYVVPTPIGNLEDMSFRAVRVLKESDLILAEDTRVSGKLLKHYDIQTPMQSHHKFNEHQTVERIAGNIKAGSCVALITDAGMPAISDPGYLLVRECVTQDVDIECLPGSTAFIPALVVSGLPNDRFTFEGFLPQKKGRQKMLTNLSEEDRTMIFYESPHRLVKALSQMADVFGSDRKCSVSREISKIHEEVKRGTLDEVREYYENNPPKGEIVICVEGAGKAKKHEVD
ncbi:16S rRNA (cytidine(1402)-2'-O)-methyltransferase [Saccharicrinis sp. FJH62]|uniref:16S rRNA (cytidine(1402)-2'-O)-methyltransferase n=1 Tax=Saccharicrinis sp. FJH62 TaxID=3344657 RepID=UPI0035D47B83